MRKIRETLRLHYDSELGQRPISRCLNISRTTVGDYLQRASNAGLSWPLPEDLTDQQLEGLLFPPAVVVEPAERPLPDFANLHKELARKGERWSRLTGQVGGGNKVESLHGYAASRMAGPA